MRFAIGLTALVFAAACGARQEPAAAPAPRQASTTTESQTVATRPASPPESAPRDPCAWLSAEEAASVLDAKASEIESVPTSPGCTMRVPEKQGGVYFAVAEGTKVFDEFAAKPTAKALDGVGDRAVVNNEWAAITDVVAVAGSRNVSVRLSKIGISDSERGDKAADVAKKIIARM
jgi:uncharacterized protein DUF3558